jgi:VWFA-related protein
LCSEAVASGKPLLVTAAAAELGRSPTVTMLNRTLPLAILVFLFGQNSSAQYEVSVTEISVWVHVVDASGNPVRGLTDKDFEVLQDGKLQTLTCFQEVTVSPESERTAYQESLDVTSKSPPRQFVLFLDLFNTSPNEYLRIRPRITEFVNQLPGKNWELMLAALTAQGKLGIIAPFTSNVSAIRTLLFKATGNGVRDSRTRNNLRDLRSVLEKADENSAYEWAIRSAYQMARNYSREEEQRSKLSIMALESFADHLRRDPNERQQTIIIYLSGGFNAEPGRQYFEMINDFIQNHGDGLDSVDQATRFPESVNETKFDIRRMVQNSVGRLNKLNITLYAINTRGMYDGGDNIDIANPNFVQFSNSFLQDHQESLAQIADETGGAFFQNSQNFKKGFDLIWNDLSHQYELCYRSPTVESTGKYHDIKVRVKRRNVNVRHRKGYLD